MDRNETINTMALARISFFGLAGMQIGRAHV